MIAKRFPIAAGLVLIGLVGSSVSAAPLFVDDFTADPAASGWVETPDGGDIVHDGVNAVFSGPGGSVQAITRSISTAGRTGLYVGYKAAANANAEDNDTLTFLVDSDGDGVFEPVASTPAGGANFSNADFAPLPAAAEDNAALPIRVAWGHNFSDEVLSLDRLTIFEAPEIIATESFDADPASSGWTEAGNVAANGAGQASLAGQPASSITKAFDLTGFVNILVNLEGLNDGFNGLDDFVTMEVDTGDGFVEVARQAGTDSPYLLGGLLPAEAEDNPNVLLRLTCDSTYGGQDTLFDALTLRGAVIPEPATLVVLALGGLGLIRRTRR